MFKSQFILKIFSTTDHSRVSKDQREWFWNWISDCPKGTMQFWVD